MDPNFSNNVMANPGQRMPGMRGGFGGHFGGQPFDSGWLWFSGIARFVLFLLIIAAIFWLVRMLLMRSGHHSPHRAAVAELDLRYARGEIDRAEYLQRRSDLTSPGALVPPAPAPAVKAGSKAAPPTAQTT